MLKKDVTDPWLKENPNTAHDTACSRSASSNTTFGDLPPSSRVTLFKFEAAAAFIMTRPTLVDPVKATLSIFMWEEMAPPTSGPKPEMMLTTPGGKTLAINEQRNKAERGVCSAVLRTMQFPVARAGPNFHAHMRMGKFPIKNRTGQHMPEQRNVGSNARNGGTNKE